MPFGKRSISTAALCLVTLFPFSAAAEDDIRCSLYGSIGGSLAEFMLPLTMQDFINMMTGEDPDLMHELSSSLLKSVNGLELAAFTKMPDKDAEIFSESAGQTAIQHLMSATASSSEDLKALMESSCNSVGADRIIRNQKRAKRLTEANLGEPTE